MILLTAYTFFKAIQLDFNVPNTENKHKVYPLRGRIDNLLCRGSAASVFLVASGFTYNKKTSWDVFFNLSFMLGNKKTSILHKINLD